MLRADLDLRGMFGKKDGLSSKMVNEAKFAEATAEEALLPFRGSMEDLELQQLARVVALASLFGCWKGWCSRYIWWCWRLQQLFWFWQELNNCLECGSLSSSPSQVRTRILFVTGLVWFFDVEFRELARIKDHITTIIIQRIGPCFT